MIHLEDPDNALTPDEFDMLKRFITDECLCTGVDTEWLDKVIVRNDGASGYLGYWAVKFLKENDLDFRNLQAVIVLNSFYLKTLEQLKRTLAHEYGHHWTLGYQLSRLEMPFNRRAEMEYYRMRGLNPPTDFAPNYSKGWYNSDKEIIAEDYKYHYTPFVNEHRMKNIVGNPSTEVKGYLWDIGFARRRTREEMLSERHMRPHQQP
jgi:hypothetical protein